jgi:hypothetical protein
VSFAYQVANERHIAPAKTSQQLAELHGKFDEALGQKAQTVYDTFFTLGARESRVLAEPAAPGFHLIGPDAAQPVGVRETQVPAGHKTGETYGEGVYWLRDVPHVDVPYLPDVFATGAAFLGLPGQAYLGQPFDGKWPDPAPFRIRIVDGPVGTAPTFIDTDADPRVLEVTVPQATIARVNLSSVLTEDDLNHMAIWHLLSTAKQGDLHGRARGGLHWMLTPSEELVLVHAVEKPLTDPSMHLDGGAIARAAADTFATLLGYLESHSHSTGRLDVDAIWDEPIDDVLQDGPTTTHGAGHVGDFTITYEEHHAHTGRDDVEAGATTAQVHKLRHEFHDTKHRWVTYTTTATTRYREYFPPEVTSNPSLITASTTGSKVSVPSSRRPDPPEVLYVVPTFKWSEPPLLKRLGQVPTTRRTRVGRGLRVYLDRPWYSSGADEYLGVVLRDQRPPWKTVFTPKRAGDLDLLAKAGIDVDTLVAAAPRLLKGVEPEKLVQVVAKAVAGGKMAKSELAVVGPELWNILFPLGDVDHYVTHWGKDPVWQSPGPGPGPRIESFENADRWDTGLVLAELPRQTAAVAAFEPQYDPERRLWYCDIELDPGPAYSPFIRMALARYQPYSVPGLELSKVVFAEFAQVLPDRTTTVRGTDTMLHVVMQGVAGYNFFSQFVRAQGGAGDDAIDASRFVRASVERRRATSTTDLDWQPITDPFFLDHAGADKGGIHRWEGRFEAPIGEDGYEYRLAVEEYELHQTDASQAEYWLDSHLLLGYDYFTGVKEARWRTPVRGRLLYADHFALATGNTGRLIPS